jgi:hypothetical protein
MKPRSLASGAVAAVLLAGAAKAANLVADPTFKDYGTQALSDSGVGSYFQSNILADWTTPSTTGNTSFLFVGGQENGNIDQSGGSCSTPSKTSGCWALWNSTNGGSTSITSGAPTGNIIVADADSTYSTSFYTAITGLVKGDRYTVTFYQAAGQQYGYGSNGNSINANWQVTLGSAASQTSTSMTANYKGFSGWEEVTMSFIASASGTLDLTFLAESTLTGVPPYALLGDVTMNEAAAPEPTTVGIISLGFLGLGFAARKRMKRRANQK